MRNARPALLLVLCAVFVAACGPTAPTSQPPQLAAVTPVSGDRGATLTVTVTGSNFVSSASTTLALSGTGITVGNVAIPNATTATATLTIAPDAPLGPRTLTITTAGGTSSSVNFTVAAEVPTLSSISPSSAPSGGVVVATLTGSGFFSDATVAVSGAGVNVSDVNVASSTSMTARFAVDAAADLGARSVTVTTAGGTTSGQTFTVAAPGPTFTSISPSFGVRGNTVTVTLSGTGLVAGATSVAVSGGGITVQNISGPLVAATGRTMTVALVIDANAAPGPRSVTITTPGGTSSATFDVRAQPPTLGSFRASSPTILQGGSTRLEWTGVTNATTCGINNDVGAVSCADSHVVVSPRATIEYQLMVIGPGGREWMYVTVNVESPPAVTPPVVGAPSSGSQAFNFTGAAQTFVVPAGVTQITVEAFGAQGAAGSGQGLGVGGAGGLGGRIQATIAVVPGATYQVNVGGRGATLANNPGGGGGGSDIRTGGTALANRVVVAGGGGGGAGANSLAPGVVGGAGGAGGGLIGGTGGTSTTAGIGGNGGTQVAGGTASAGTNPGQPGTLGQGGAGCCGAFGGAGGFNGGGQAGPSFTGGPGGGGFFGGGGGSDNGGGTAGGGGGGGSSFASGTNVTHTQGVRSGNGIVTITW